MRSFTPGRPKALPLKPTKAGAASKPREGVLIKDDLKALGGELAIVCPLVDGRMRDVAGDAQ